MELRGHFAGKRCGKRFPRVLDCTVEGTEGTFAARTVDLSRSGILLRIADPSFAGEEEIEDLKLYGELVMKNFGSRITVSFGGGTVRRQAMVVRVAQGNGGSEEGILVGCRFRRPLSAQACLLLGIEALCNDGDASPGARRS
ncbi:MAG: PilZ domain-containing protein [Planctomycetota bacterium]